MCCCSTTTLAQDSSEFQRKHTASNSICNLTVNESAIQEVLRWQDEPTVNVIKIKISYFSGNEKLYRSEMIWASETGRTIISLLWYVENKYTIFSSPLYTGILTVGTEEVELKLNCLPSGNDTADQIFKTLLDEFFFHSKDAHVFKLCRVRNDAYHPFECCRISGPKNLKNCDAYSSLVVDLGRPSVITMFLISFFVSSFLVEYVVSYRSIDKPKFYKTSESHMSLTSVCSRILFEGCGLVKSLFRRCIFAGLLLLVFVPARFFDFPSLKVVFGIWCGAFVMTYDVQMTFDKCQTSCIQPLWTKNELIDYLTLPFRKIFRLMESYLKSEDILDSKCEFPLCIRPRCCKNLWCEEDCCTDWTRLSFFWKFVGCPILSFWYGFLSLCVIILLCAFALSLSAFYFTGAVLTFIFCFVLPYHLNCPPNYCPLNCRRNDSLKCSSYCGKVFVTILSLLFILLRLGTIFGVIFLNGMILILGLVIIVGVTLNAEYFNPFVAPIVTLVVYFWKNWKFCIETECLHIKTCIIQFCKEKAPKPQDAEEQDTNDQAAKERNKSIKGK
jgi:hypothetical protein